MQQRYVVQHIFPGHIQTKQIQILSRIALNKPVLSKHLPQHTPHENIFLSTMRPVYNKHFHAGIYT